MATHDSFCDAFTSYDAGAYRACPGATTLPAAYHQGDYPPLALPPDPLSPLLCGSMSPFSGGFYYADAETPSTALTPASDCDNDPAGSHLYDQLTTSAGVVYGDALKGAPLPDCAGQDYYACYPPVDAARSFCELPYVEYPCNGTTASEPFPSNPPPHYSTLMTVDRSLYPGWQSTAEVSATFSPSKQPYPCQPGVHYDVSATYDQGDDVIASFPRIVTPCANSKWRWQHERRLLFISFFF